MGIVRNINEAPRSKLTGYLIQIQKLNFQKLVELKL